MEVRIAVVSRKSSDLEAMWREICLLNSNQEMKILVICADTDDFDKSSLPAACELICIEPFSNMREPYLAFGFACSEYFRVSQLDRIYFLGDEDEAFLTATAVQLGLISADVYFLERRSSGDDLEQELYKSLAHDLLRQRSVDVDGTSFRLISPPTPSDETISVSCVVVHYNRPDTIRFTLESLVRQSETDFDIVVVDDCSCPEHFAQLQRICRDFPGVRVVQTPENGGLGYCRNTGLNHITTDYVVYIDDDDLAHPDMIRILRQARRHWPADAIIAGMNYARFEAGDTDFSVRNGRNILYYNHGLLSLAQLKNNIGGSTSLMRVDSLKRAGGFHQVRGVGVDDWFLYSTMRAMGMQTGFLPVPLLWYRDTQSSMSKTINRDQGRLMMAEALDALVCPSERYHYVINSLRQTLDQRQAVQRQRSQEPTFLKAMVKGSLIRQIDRGLPVYINGAGEFGTFVCSFLRSETDIGVTGFIDRNLKEHATGLPVFANVDAVPDSQFQVYIASDAFRDEILHAIQQSEAWHNARVRVLV